MARRRLKPKGKTIFHCMTRTAQQVFWLADPEVKDIFIDFYSEVYYCRILGYCVMDNQFLCDAPHKK